MWSVCSRSSCMREIRSISSRTLMICCGSFVARSTLSRHPPDSARPTNGSLWPACPNTGGVVEPRGVHVVDALLDGLVQEPRRGGLIDLVRGAQRGQAHAAETENGDT